jgi:hypothetical protein
MLTKALAQKVSVQANIWTATNWFFSIDHLRDKRLDSRKNIAGHLLVVQRNPTVVSEGITLGCGGRGGIFSQDIEIGRKRGDRGEEKKKRGIYKRTGRLFLFGLFKAHCFTPKNPAFTFILEGGIFKWEKREQAERRGGIPSRSTCSAEKIISAGFLVWASR